jgi:hypothetical protein
VVTWVTWHNVEAKGKTKKGKEAAMDNGNYALIVDGSPVPLRPVENIRLVTPARDEHPATVAARLARSSRLAIDPTYPPDSLVVRGDRQKLEEISSYRDIQNTRGCYELN